MKEVESVRKSGKKCVYIEALRIFSCLLVIFNHTGDLGFSMFTTFEPGSARFWIYMVPSIFCKAAVYLFLAISGAFLLAKEEPLSVIWKKRIPRIAGAVLFFTLFYYCWDLGAESRPFQITEFLRYLLKDGIHTPMWYLYFYLGFLVCLPFLRALVRNLKDVYFEYMFLLCFLFCGVLPVLAYFAGSSFHARLSVKWMVPFEIFYPCMGYYLHNRLSLEKAKKLLLPMWILNILTIGISCFGTYCYGMALREPFSQQNSQAFHTYFVMVNTVTLFLTFRCFFESVRIPERISRLIILIGGCSMGVYLTHIWFLDKLIPYRNFRWHYPWILHIPLPVAVIIDCITILLMGTGVTLILKRIPVLKKLV